MNKNKPALFTYLLLMANYFIQGGASLFATTVSVSTLVQAPPRSLTMVQGEFPFNPEIFWNVFPNIGFVLFVIALIANWRTPYRRWVVSGWLVSLVAAVVAIFFLVPVQEEFLSAAYADTVDPELMELGHQWFTYSVSFLSISMLAGLVLIIGLLRVKPDNH